MLEERGSCIISPKDKSRREKGKRRETNLGTPLLDTPLIIHNPRPFPHRENKNTKLRSQLSQLQLQHLPYRSAPPFPG